MIEIQRLPPIMSGVSGQAWQDGDAELVQVAARDSGLASQRASLASSAATRLRSVGLTARTVGHVVGDGRVSGVSERGNGDDALVGIGVLTQIAADLLDASGSLLSGTNHYAGAALLRQVVEVEYLTWAFANNKRDAAAWVNSTHEERRRMFTPAGLRTESDGHFLSEDYGHHCEQGGHPVPRAIPLLGSPDPIHSQVLLVDLLLHSWRTADNIAAWAKNRNDAPLLVQLRLIRSDFARWGQHDPLYALAVKKRPSQ